LYNLTYLDPLSILQLASHGSGVATLGIPGSSAQVKFILKATLGTKSSNYLDYTCTSVPLMCFCCKVSKYSECMIVL